MDNKTICDIIAVIEREVLAPLQGLLLALAALFFLFGLVEFIAGASSEEARTKGKTHMIWGFVGIVVMLAAWAIIAVFQNFFGSSLGGLCTY